MQAISLRTGHDKSRVKYKGAMSVMELCKLAGDMNHEIVWMKIVWFRIW